MDIFEQISVSVSEGDRKKVVTLINSGLENGLSPLDLLNKGLIAGMDIVAEEWKNNEIFIPEVLVAARAMASGNEIIEKLLIKSESEQVGTVVIGTVKGDLHDIGKNLVAMMLKGKGFEVVDLGVNVTKEQFVETAKSTKAKFVCMSTLLTTTMSYFKEVIDEFEKESLRNDVKIFVGGAPITQSFADEIGADFFTKDAVSASEVMYSLAGN